MINTAQFTIQTEKTSSGSPEIIIELPSESCAKIFGLTKDHAKEWIISLSEAIGHIENYENAVEALDKAKSVNP